MIMLTIEALKQFGADTNDGLSRCMGNEAFYFKLIGKVIDDKNFAALEEAIASKNYDTAFEIAHSMKGVLGNLALTPIYTPVCEMTELPRNRTDADYAPFLKTISEKRAELAAMI